MRVFANLISCHFRPTNGHVMQSHSVSIFPSDEVLTRRIKYNLPQVMVCM